MKLTENQQRVLTQLRDIGRRNVLKYRGDAHLHNQDLEKLRKGDDVSAFGLGGLTFQVGSQLGMTPGSVLSTFKALERKGLVLRETRNPEYQRPLYWWPMGLAAELHAELTATNGSV
jgi:DNA-binding MarR family transcriptional regulator